jgi:hypothetical protein
VAVAFARGIKHPLDVSVQRSQHSASHVHQEIAAFGGADQATRPRFAIPRGRAACSLDGLRAQPHDTVSAFTGRVK